MLRLRDYRMSEEIRSAAREIHITCNDLILPVFVKKNIASGHEKINTLPGVFRHNYDSAIKLLEKFYSLGGRKCLLFGVIDNSQKTTTGDMAWDKESPIVEVIPLIKRKFPTMTIIADVCLCGYTDHGHCGLISMQQGIQIIENDPSLPLLAKAALAYAHAGADIVAPSAMMDGQVQTIKDILQVHKLETKILSYSIKYASNLYGPFRDAMSSAPSFSDRKTYQMDFRNLSQAFEEAKTDLAEGADILMVKPAGMYLDIINRIKTGFPKIKLVAYQVSGEYAMIHAAATAGILDFNNVYLESLYAIKRAGADFIITYGAIHVLELFNQDKKMNEKLKLLDKITNTGKPHEDK